MQKRCGTCKFAAEFADRDDLLLCTAPIPVWVDTDKLTDLGRVNTHEGRLCPLWKKIPS